MGKGGREQVDRKELMASEHAWAEITKHRTPEDAWMMINNKVYDVSSWHEHPGGDVIFTSAGDDATDFFALFHAQGTAKHLAPFCIGSLAEADRKKWADERPKSDEQMEFEKGYRRLKREMRAAGLFESSPLYYFYKQLSTLMIAALAAYLVAAFSERTWAHFAVRSLGACIMGVFFQQCGWLCHEICHHQVFANRRLGRCVGYFWGNVAQGFSVGWWCNKHNTHHAVPNVHGTEGAQNGDPDIDTMPLLAWSRSMLKHAVTPMAQTLVKYQALTYFPLLSVARLSWLQQSLAFVCKSFSMDTYRGGRIISGSATPARPEGVEKPLEDEGLEFFLLGVHYLWYFGVAFSSPSWLHALSFVLLSNVACGLSLALVFGLGHNGMAVYDAEHRPDYWKLQVTTTRNVKQDAFGFIHWFCGGLDYQVEHHLFPTLPRHSLKEANRLVQRFCKEYGVSYHETDMWTGTVEVLTHLQKIAYELHDEFPAM
mmetsp:Transcript_24748/g.74261  ORF Transcript_24748/g.74261 Transcript_24748/m.74261 type:complete len:484 (-) Transcript_24748:74-1525(-)